MFDKRATWGGGSGLSANSILPKYFGSDPSKHSESGFNMGTVYDKPNGGVSISS